MKFEEYNIDEHIHRYAVWTAARAASVSRFSNGEIEQFITASKLREELQKISSLSAYSKEAYKVWFVKQVNAILSIMDNYKQPKDKKRTVSFGISAKIVSIYIKTVEVIPTKGKSIIAKLAYPPIDSILLKTLKENKKVDLKSTTWSVLDKNAYMEILDKLSKVIEKNPFWKLENYWDVRK